MAHHPVDAVKYWNEEGRFYGARSEPVREFMTDPNNYRLEPVASNGSARWQDWRKPICARGVACDNVDGRPLCPPKCQQKYMRKIARLSAQGDTLARGKNMTIIVNISKPGFLPEPKTGWEATTWLLAAIGYANFFQPMLRQMCGDIHAGHCQHAGGLGNPFLHLRLGESLLNLRKGRAYVHHS